MPLSLTAPPAGEPVTLAEAKAHLKLDTSDDDSLVTALITAARARAEWHTGRALMTQGWTLWLDAWPESGMIELPLPPLVAVTSITVHARDDSASTFDPARTVVDAVSGRIALKQGAAAPLNLRVANAIEVAFTAGYGDVAADVPQLVREAILELVAFLYEHRGEAPADLPMDVLALLAPYRVLKI